VRKFFAEPKTLLTLSSLWTQRTRPQGTWKTAKSAVFHSANSDQFFLEEEKRTTDERQEHLNPTVH
jgi:hypothetical protein